MYNQELLAKLKQTNLSTDMEKTRQRFSIIWNSATKQQKMTVQNLTALTRPSINRVCRMGNVSAKMAVAMGMVLGVNPFYLVGEADENIPCTDELLDIFLESKGYKRLLVEIKPGKVKKAKEQAPALSQAEQAPVLPDALDVVMSDLTEDELYYLLAGLRVRAKRNAEAQIRYQQVLDLLVK